MKSYKVNYIYTTICLENTKKSINLLTKKEEEEENTDSNVFSTISNNKRSVCFMKIYIKIKIDTKVLGDSVSFTYKKYLASYVSCIL